ncbi:UNVERIFIED_CONTAM: hypothetical protein Scaly_2909900 [Sesamum calycinum]|uniref:Uncharacterized protein n=1 Tax=Sesamum calycinum TaxID=2727403 RepID=A0AAW2L501_9LAMI
MTSLDLNQQPLSIEYPTLDVDFELKSGLIHLLPISRGLASEDPHKHLKAELNFCPPTLSTQSRWLYPLHLASANDHLEIVQFWLEFGKHKSALEELCMKKDRDGKTALHSAVVTGKISVIDLLFDHCPDAAKEVTIHRESVLHLAVKHHQ